MNNKEFDLKHLVGKMTKKRLEQCLKLADEEILEWRAFAEKAKEAYEQTKKSKQ